MPTIKQLPSGKWTYAYCGQYFDSAQEAFDDAFATYGSLDCERAWFRKWIRQGKKLGVDVSNVEYEMG